MITFNKVHYDTGWECHKPKNPTSPRKFVHHFPLDIGIIFEDDEPQRAEKQYLKYERSFGRDALSGGARKAMLGIRTKKKATGPK